VECWVRLRRTVRLQSGTCRNSGHVSLFLAWMMKVLLFLVSRRYYILFIWSLGSNFSTLKHGFLQLTWPTTKYELWLPLKLKGARTCRSNTFLVESHLQLFEIDDP
jgi:hypothetical protein